MISKLLVRGRSIRFQFILFVVLLLSFVVGVISFFTLRTEKKELLAERKMRGLSIVKSIAQQSWEAVGDDDPLTLHDILDGLITQDSSYDSDISEAMIISLSGRIICHLNHNLDDKKIKTKLFSYIKKKKALGVIEYTKKNKKYLEFWAPVRPPGKNKIIAFSRLSLSVDSINEKINVKRNAIILFSVLILLFALIAIIILVNIMTKPISVLSEGAKIIGSGDLKYRFKERKGNEIDKLASIFNKMTQNLDNAQDALIENKRLEHELEIAEAIQKTLLPKQLPSVSNLDFAAFYNAAQQVGGDYYDFIEVDNDHLGIVIADVSGKSISGAFVMGVTRATLRSLAKDEHSPSIVLSKVNKVLRNDIKRGMFVTMLYCILNKRTLKFTFASAGHDPLFYKKDKQDFELFNPDGFALGVRNEKGFDSKITETSITLEVDDLIVLTTDGTNEAMSLTYEQFGEEKMYKTLNENSSQSSTEISDNFIKVLRKHTDGAVQSDDITFVVLKITK